MAQGSLFSTPPRAPIVTLDGPRDSPAVLPPVFLVAERFPWRLMRDAGSLATPPQTGHPSPDRPPTQELGVARPLQRAMG